MAKAKATGNTMEQTIYAKKRTTKEGKTFYNYFTSLTKKDGEEITAQVKFKEECGSPAGADCPVNIVFDRSDANYREKLEHYTDPETGEERETTRRTLWISKWEEGSEFIDTSMDAFA